ncbi:MAG: class I SAM-dependent methyltransferase [Myxococcota bacterium]
MAQTSFSRYDRIVEFYPTMWPLLVPGYGPVLGGMFDVVRVRPTAPRRLLDLGCGPASATVAVAPACDPSARVTLVDGSSRMIDAAQSLLGPQVQEAIAGDFTDADVASHCFEKERYDLALVSFALHHCEDPTKRQIIDHLYTALEPGGMLLMADEIASDRPAGWDLVERVRARVIHEQLASGAILKEFWDLETTLPASEHLPFKPSRVDDLTSWMARAGFAVSCPVSVFGSALLVALKPI